MANTIYGRPM